MSASLDALGAERSPKYNKDVVMCVVNNVVTCGVMRVVMCGVMCGVIVLKYAW